MPVQIGEKRQADFHDPLAMLSDCHRRIERFLAVLLKIARERSGAPLNDAERAALHNALDYFRQSGPRHTEDEEESLFPRLRSCPQAAAALSSVEALHSDHVVASETHNEVDQLVSLWLENGSLGIDQAARLSDYLEALERLYARHIAVEDQQLFPVAARALTVHDIASIGEEMARRRGLR